MPAKTTVANSVRTFSRLILLLLLIPRIRLK